jgi:hypothetical protein
VLLPFLDWISANGIVVDANLVHKRIVSQSYGGAAALGTSRVVMDTSFLRSDLFSTQGRELRYHHSSGPSSPSCLYADSMLYNWDFGCPLPLLTKSQPSNMRCQTRFTQTLPESEFFLSLRVELIGARHQSRACNDGRLDVRR